MSTIEFPYRFTPTLLGNVVEPKIPVEVLTPRGFETFGFLVDTGADCTMLPRYMARDLGITLGRRKRLRTFGIEQSKGITVYLDRIHIKIGEISMSIRCLFSNRDTTPFLLGRLDIFDKFTITFDNAKKVVRFEALP